VTLLLVLVFEPRIVLENKFSSPKKIAVLIDQSRSMNRAWQGSNAELKTNIRGIVAKIEENHKVDLWSLGGDEIHENSLSFEDDMSIFDWNPSLGDRNEVKNLYSSVFLISDGHLNGGRSPLDNHWTSTIPVYPIYPLQPISSAELKVIETTHQISESSSDAIEITIKIQQDGLIGKMANIQILTALDQLIGETSLRLDQVFSETTVSVRLPAVESQTFKITAFLEKGDFYSESYLNIDFQDPVKSVLIVSERVNELHKFLKLSLADSLFRQEIVLGTAYRAGDSFQASSREKYDLIILNDPGPTVLTDKLESLIRASIASNCPVILFSTGLEPLQITWLDLLGIRESSINFPSGDETAYWNQVASDHAFYLGLMGRGFAPETILEYPPIQSARYSQSFDGAKLIGIGIGEKYKSGFILGDSPPMAIFNGAGFWKWFFHPQSKDSFQKFWNYLLIYLNDIANFEPVTINLPVITASTGAFVEVEVLVKDLDNRIIPAAELRVWQENESGQKQPLNLSRMSSGAYSSQLNTNTPGLATIIAEAYRFGELWGRDTSRLQLVSFSGEDQSKGVDEIFLTRLANRSGGQVIQTMDIDLPIIQTSLTSGSSSYQLKGVRSPTLFVILVILLILEWIIRRRTGLL